MSSNKYIIILPIQCKAARELLEWKQEDLSKSAKIAKETIGKFERKISNPTLKTLINIKETFEKAGIKFKNDDEAIGVELMNQDVTTKDENI